MLTTAVPGTIVISVCTGVGEYIGVGVTSASGPANDSPAIWGVHTKPRTEAKITIRAKSLLILRFCFIAVFLLAARMLVFRECESPPTATDCSDKCPVL
jgi:hypothetical protein